MENKEMKKPIPEELNEEELDTVAGGGNAVPSLAVNAGNLDFRPATEGERCSICGKVFEKGEMIHSIITPLFTKSYCERCFRTKG